MTGAGDAREDLSWQDDAKCRRDDALDLEDFYPPKHVHARATARELCDGCPVASECLSYALRHNERFGIWGGKTERERRAIRRGDVEMEDTG